MQVPIKFPSDAEVIREEVARFRALSPDERVGVIRGLVATGARIMRQSDNASFQRTIVLEQEELWRQAVKEFITRHGG
jgi:hypothetical protein